MSLYVTLPHLQVQRANAFAASGLMSLTPVMAANLMAEAFGFFWDLKVEGVLFLHHDAQLLAEQSLEPKQPDKLHLLKFQGATLFNTSDVNSKNLGADPRPRNSDQPNAFMSGQWSLVLQVNDTGGVTPELLRQSAVDFLDFGPRFAGGVIQTHGGPAAGYQLFGREGYREDWGVIDRSIGNGFAVVDRSAALVQHEKTRAETMISMLVDPKSSDDQQGAEPKRKFYSPAVLGYALLTEPKERDGARENKEHAYCESMVGLVELISLRNLKDENLMSENLFWAHGWPTEDVFLLTQKITTKE